ncbi:lactate dehydrogenase [Bacteroidales bacterium 6E]|nr:lactate dehydrogenase [Bacteroidales bacterium 6E]
MSIKIVVLDGYTLNPGDLEWDEISALGELKVYDRTDPGDIMERASGAEALFTNKVIITRETIANLPALKFIGVLATGYNVVDTEAAREAGIIVTNIPAYSTQSVAQLAFAHILNFARQVDLHARQVREGAWTGHRDFCFWSTPQTELTGKVLGIIGFGRIGQAIAKIGDAMGMEVIFQNHRKKENIQAYARQVSLEELLHYSDYISINCPLTADNQGFINKETLSLMKPDAFLINTGRGPLINEQDLADALNSGKIAGAGLDVLSIEPAREGNPLLTAKNCYITPHIAWATKEARVRLMGIAASNLKSFMEGNPVNVVS